MNEPKPNEDKIQEIVRDLKRGKSVKEISKEYGVSRQTMYNWLAQATIDPKKYKPIVSSEIAKKIDTLVEKNWSRADISKELKISRYTLDKYLSANKLSTSGGSQNCKLIDDSESMADIQSMLNCGISQTKIAEKYGVSSSRITQYIQEKGLIAKKRAKATTENIHQISILLASGYKVYEISNIMNISESTVSKWINKYGLRK